MVTNQYEIKSVIRYDEKIKEQNRKAVFLFGMTALYGMMAAAHLEPEKTNQILNSLLNTKNHAYLEGYGTEWKGILAMFATGFGFAASLGTIREKNTIKYLVKQLENYDEIKNADNIEIISR